MGTSGRRRQGLRESINRERYQAFGEPLKPWRPQSLRSPSIFPRRKTSRGESRVSHLAGTGLDVDVASPASQSSLRCLFSAAELHQDQSRGPQQLCVGRV